MAYKKKQKSTFQKVTMVVVVAMLALIIFSSLAMALSAF